MGVSNTNNTEQRQDAAACIDTTVKYTLCCAHGVKHCQEQTGLASMTAVTRECADVGIVDSSGHISAQTTAARFASPAH